MAWFFDRDIQVAWRSGNEVRRASWPEGVYVTCAKPDEMDAEDIVAGDWESPGADQEKRRSVEGLLSSGRPVNINFFVSPKCVLPDFLKGEDLVLFTIGYDLAPNPIIDFMVNEEGVSGGFSFNRVPHHCFVPWDCILYATDGTTEHQWIYSGDEGTESSKKVGLPCTIRGLPAPDSPDLSEPRRPDLRLLQGGA